MRGHVKIPLQAALARLGAPGLAVNHWLQWANGRYRPETLRRRTLEQARKLAPLLPWVRDGLVVEVGTGWELIAPILFHLMGARRIHSYDHLRHLEFAVPAVVVAQLPAAELEAILGVAVEAPIARLRRCRSLDELLAAAGIVYHAPADARATGLAPGSVDLFFSYEVLEHVPEDMLEDLVAESRRLLKPHGTAFHAIEPGDHFRLARGSHIGHYRYPEWLWSALVKNRLIFHNRLCVRQFVECFERHGARIGSRRDRLCSRDLAALRAGFRRDARFAGYSPEDLAVWYSEITYGFDAAPAGAHPPHPAEPPNTSAQILTPASASAAVASSATPDTVRMVPEIRFSHEK